MFPPRLNQIIAAANTMALNSSSRLFEGCRLHRHHNPLHLALSLTDRQTGGNGEGGGGGMERVGALCITYNRVINNVHLQLRSFFPVS